MINVQIDRAEKSSHHSFQNTQSYHHANDGITSLEINFSI